MTKATHVEQGRSSTETPVRPLLPIESWPERHSPQEIQLLVQSIQQNYEHWRNTPDGDTELRQRLEASYHDDLLSLMDAVQDRVGHLAALYRSVQPVQPEYQAYQNETILHHCILLGWLLEQPEWPDHRHGLDVDAELPEKIYLRFLPEYLTHAWLPQSRRGAPRSIDAGLFATYWKLPQKIPSLGLR